MKLENIYQLQKKVYQFDQHGLCFMCVFFQQSIQTKEKKGMSLYM